MAIPALLALLTMTGTAQAAGPGEMFPVAGLDLPPGGLAASFSGGSGEDIQASPVSADGRYVAFVSGAETLAPGADPDVANVFRKDRVTGDVVLVSRATGADGAGAGATTSLPRIAADGNLVAFVTGAALDPADADGARDVYIRDVAAGTTTLATPGVTGPVLEHDLSANGAYLAFSTPVSLVAADTNGVADVYRRALAGGPAALVSQDSGAGAANDSSGDPAISGDGRWVAFSSEATDLIAGFTAGAGDVNVFARDVTAGTTHLVSSQVLAATTGGNGDSQSPDIAGTPGADTGTVYVAYDSYATNVAILGDDSGQSSVYRRRLSGAGATLVSRSTTGVNADARAHSPAISDDGNLVAFGSDATNLGAGDDYYGVYVRDVAATTTVLGSATNEYAIQPALAANGGVLTWYDGRSDHVAGGDADLIGVFGRTLPGGPVEHVSRPAGAGAFLSKVVSTDRVRPGERALSADGRYAVFTAYSRRLAGAAYPMQVYRRDTLTGALELVSRATGADGAPAPQGADEPSISADGTRVVFTSRGPLDPADPDDGISAVYVRDLAAGTTVLASRGDGAEGVLPDDDAERPGISAGGRHVTFTSRATNLGGPAGNDDHVYWRDLDAGRTQIVDRAAGADGPVGTSDAEGASLSADGRRVVFATQSDGLDPADPDGSDRDVFVRDIGAQTTTLVSRLAGPDGADTPGSNREPVISADGAKVAFVADHEPIAPEAGTWNGQEQIVLRDLASGQNTLVSRAPGGPAGDVYSGVPAISADGAVVAFESYATNLVPGLGGDVRGAVYAWTAATGALTAPPAFGRTNNSPQHGAYAPSLSDDGQCLSFDALGHTAAGFGDDLGSRYVLVVSGACPKPLPVTPQPQPQPAEPRPAISQASLSRSRFRAGRAATPRAAARAKTGTSVRFTLSAAADVSMAIQRRATGRKVGTACRKPAPRLRKRPRCVRWATSGALTRAGRPAGAQAIAFTGRIGKRKLTPGRYRMVLVARNAGGKSKPVRLAFRVVKR